MLVSYLFDLKLVLVTFSMLDRMGFLQQACMWTIGTEFNSTRETL